MQEQSNSTDSPILKFARGPRHIGDTPLQETIKFCIADRLQNTLFV